VNRFPLSGGQGFNGYSFPQLRLRQFSGESKIFNQHACFFGESQLRLDGGAFCASELAQGVGCPLGIVWIDVCHGFLLADSESTRFRIAASA
jgi:hypothetical protein